MDPVLNTFAPLDTIESDFLNDLQDAVAITDDVDGHMAQRPAYWSFDGDDVTIGPVRALSIGGKSYSTTSNTTVTFSGLSGTWGYLYAKVTAGALAFEVNNTAPAAGFVWSNNTTRTLRYLGAVRLASATTCSAFRCVGGYYVYRRSSAALVGFVSVPGSGQATTQTSIDLDDWVPPHAFLVDAHVRITTTGSESQYVELYTYPDSFAAFEIKAPSTSGACTHAETVTIEAGQHIDGSRLVDYKWTGDPTVPDGVFGLSVVAFYEPE